MKNKKMIFEKIMTKASFKGHFEQVGALWGLMLLLIVLIWNIFTIILLILHFMLLIKILRIEIKMKNLEK